MSRPTHRAVLSTQAGFSCHAVGISLKTTKTIPVGQDLESSAEQNACPQHPRGYRTVHWRGRRNEWTAFRDWHRRATSLWYHARLVVMATSDGGCAVHGGAEGEIASSCPSPLSTQPLSTGSPTQQNQNSLNSRLYTHIRKGWEYNIFSIMSVVVGSIRLYGVGRNDDSSLLPHFPPLITLNSPLSTYCSLGVEHPEGIRRQHSVATSVLNPFVILLTVAISMNQSHVRLSHSKSIVEMPNKTLNSYRVKAPAACQRTL